MSKHTPGPWAVFDKNIQAGGLLPIVHRTKWWAHGIDEIEDAANARLIAAAPELLEAAKKALGALNALHIQGDVACVVEPEGEIYLRPVINALRQVIAKATGEQA